MDLSDGVQVILSGDAAKVSNYMKSTPKQAISSAISQAMKIVGQVAATKPGSARQAAENVALATAIFSEIAISSDGDSFTVSGREFNNAGRIPWGFEKVIPAGTTADVTLQASVPARPKQLYIPETLAPGLELTVLQVAQQSYLLDGTSVPLEVFSDNSLVIDWKIKTVQIGQSIKMTFMNNTGADVTLRGAWMCDYVS